MAKCGAVVAPLAIKLLLGLVETVDQIVGTFWGPLGWEGYYSLAHKNPVGHEGSCDRNRFLPSYGVCVH